MPERLVSDGHSVATPVDHSLTHSEPSAPGSE